MRRIFLFASVTLLLFPTVSYAWTLSGFESPKTMQVDPETGAYYVSNIQGEPSAKDGGGYISKITPNGSIVIQKFIGGKAGSRPLNAPKGLWVTEKEIFAADIDAVKVFDKANGKLTVSIDMAPWGAQDLNDLVMDNSGYLYVCDQSMNKIFKIDTQANFEVAVFREGAVLGRPNGLMINPKSKHLMAVTWEGGQILEIEPKGRIHVLKRGLHKLDGIDYDVEGNLYVSSVEKGEVYRIPFYGRGTLTIFLSGLASPANISCDRKRHELLVPSLTGHSASTYPLIKKLERKQPPVQTK